MSNTTDDRSEENLAVSAHEAFSAGDLDHAIRLCTAAEDARKRDRPEASSDSYRKLIGVALWIKGKRSDAANVWCEIVHDLIKHKIAYSDFGGGLLPGALLWFSSIYPENSSYRSKAESFLQKRISSKRRWPNMWPIPIGHYLVNSISKEDLLNLAESSSTLLSYRQLSQAHFYIACKDFGLENVERYRSTMQLAAEIGIKNTCLEDEWELARFEGGKIPQGLIRTD